jgi:hypothetical protein
LALDGLRSTYLNSTISNAKSAFDALRPSFLDTVTAANSMFETLRSNSLRHSSDLQLRDFVQSYTEVEDQDAYALHAFLELRSVEKEIRSIIANALSTMFGEDWVESKVPPHLVKKWRDRRATATLSGEKNAPLLYYADFSDYAAVLTHEDNWSVVFFALFSDCDEVISSIQRLNMVRRPTMHSRDISIELLRVLKVEVARLRRALKLVVH